MGFPDGSVGEPSGRVAPVTSDQPRDAAGMASSRLNGATAMVGSKVHSIEVQYVQRLYIYNDN